MARDSAGGSGPATPEPVDPRLAAALTSVKSLVSIVMGLALTHTLLTLLTEGGESEAVGGETGPALLLSDISPQSALCALAVVTAIVRFYHGNNQLLETFFGESSRGQADREVKGIGVNFIVIMVQSVLFALMSFYVTGSPELILLFFVLLVLDIFWYVANWTTIDTDKDALAQQRAWMLNNLFFCFFLGFLYFTQEGEWTVTAGAAAILLNTLRDFAISWEFYFPPRENGSVSESP